MSSVRLALALVVCASCWFSGVAWAADEAAVPAKPVAPEVARLIVQLDSEQFAERQAASKKLVELGKSAVPSLAEAAAGSSLEVTARAVEILKKLHESDDDGAKQAAKAELEKLVKGGNVSAARRAREALGIKEPEPSPQPRGIQPAVQVPNDNIKSIKTTENADGSKSIEVETTLPNGAKAKIVDDPKKGITMELTTKDDKGKEKTSKIEAKDADELKKKDAAAHDIYQQCQARNAAEAARQARIARLGAARAVKAKPQIAIVPQLIKGWSDMLESSAKPEEIKGLAGEKRDELAKNLETLKKQLADVEKLMKAQAKKLAEQPAEKPKDKPEEAKPAANTAPPAATSKTLKAKLD